MRMYGKKLSTREKIVAFVLTIAVIFVISLLPADAQEHGFAPMIDAPVVNVNVHKSEPNDAWAPVHQRQDTVWMLAFDDRALSDRGFFPSVEKRSDADDEVEKWAEFHKTCPLIRNADDYLAHHLVEEARRQQSIKLFAAISDTCAAIRAIQIAGNLR